MTAPFARRRRDARNTAHERITNSPPTVRMRQTSPPDGRKHDVLREIAGLYRGGAPAGCRKTWATRMIRMNTGFHAMTMSQSVTTIRRKVIAP
jgi:hypothetical protein